MKLIGIEEHFLTNEVRNLWKTFGLPEADPSIAVHSREIERRLLDLSEERLELMDETGIEIQVLSLTTPALHQPETESVDLARRLNDYIAEIVARHPHRFQALATLPVASPDEAAEEFDRCVRTLGFKGTMLCGRVGERNLDDTMFEPILREAEILGAPILLHPQIPTASVRAAYYSGFDPQIDAAFASYGLGWHYETGIQFIRLVLSGAFDRMPGLQMILGHWGELVMFYAERLAALDRVSKLAARIATCLRRNLYLTPSGMFLPRYLERAADIVGVERLLFSTDYPYQYRTGNDANRFLATCGLDDDAKVGFAHRNWERLTEGRC